MEPVDMSNEYRASPLIQVVDYARRRDRCTIASPSLPAAQLEEGHDDMTDDEVLQEEIRAVRAYFTHHQGADGRPLSDVVAPLLRHCHVGCEQI
jgi:hypothetical protein